MAETVTAGLYGDRFSNDQWPGHLECEGIALAVEIGDGCNRSAPLETRPGMGIARPSVEGIAPFGANTQRTHAVAVARMKRETEALEAREIAGRAPAQGAH